MKRTLSPLSLSVMALAFAAVQAVCHANDPTGTAFTYQGQLLDDGEAVNDEVDLIFELFDKADGGNQIGPTLTVNDFDVSDGIFTINLDFGDVFTGEERWLEITVNDNTLTPRQPVRPAPMALSLPGLYSVWDGFAPNIIGGSGSTVGADRIGVTIGGGSTNSADGNYVTIAGGIINSAAGEHSTIGGGINNLASGLESVASGGANNVASGSRSTVGGGLNNVASDTTSTVAGGSGNTASGFRASVGGGINNLADGAHSTVAGGLGNEATHLRTTVGGGENNVASGERATVAGGYLNEASGFRATVGGGVQSTASGSWSTVAGGRGNTASGSRSAVPGGEQNLAGGDHSFAAGRRAKALHDGAFVWADSFDADFGSTGADQFLIRADGGVGINTNDPLTMFSVNGNADISGQLGVGTTPAGVWQLTVEGGSRFGFPTDSPVGFTVRSGGTTRLSVAPWGGVTVGGPGGAGFPEAGNLWVAGRAGIGAGTANPGTFHLAVAGNAAKPGGGSWAVWSDARLKRDIEPLAPGMLDHLLSLHAYRFHFVDEAIEGRIALPGEQIGLIAQEVAEVFPDWVDQDEDGYLFVTERHLTAIMVEALRELRAEKDAEIDSLHERIAQLESLVADLAANSEGGVQ